MLPDVTSASVRQRFDDIETHAATVEEIGSLAGGFAPKMADVPALPSVDIDDPRPQPFPGILALGNREENYDGYLNAAKMQAPALAARIEEISGKSTEDIGMRVYKEQDLAKRMNPASLEHKQALDQLEHLQRAWAFTKAREMAGGAAPFGKAADTPLSPLQLALEEAGRALFGRL